jgi:hypothetical protein
MVEPVRWTSPFDSVVRVVIAHSSSRWTGSDIVMSFIHSYWEFEPRGKGHNVKFYFPYLMYVSSVG